VIEVGRIFDGGFPHTWPREPVKRYELFQVDTLFTRLLLAHATATIRCPPFTSAGGRVWVFGFDSASARFAKPTIRGTWHVLGAWEHDPKQLYGLIRDLWGAQAFVAAMQRRIVPRPDSAPKREAPP
jgi:hypothetical protein